MGKLTEILSPFVRCASRECGVSFYWEPEKELDIPCEICEGPCVRVSGPAVLQLLRTHPDVIAPWARKQMDKIFCDRWESRGDAIL